MGVAIGLDYFPARVTLPSGVELNPARVFVVDGAVQVWIVKEGVPALYYEGGLIEPRGSSIRGYDLAVDDGIVRVEKASGCGCGNPLRSYNPWPGERRHLVAL